MPVGSSEVVEPWWDLTHALGPETPVYPGDPEVSVRAWPAPEPARLCALRCGTHSGTHVDAPAHVLPGGATMQALPATSWSGLAWVLSLAPDRQGEVGPEELALLWPEPAPQRVLLRASPPARALRAPHRPLALAAAEWLVSQGVRLLGTEAWSVEGEGDPSLPVHRCLLGAGVLLVEGLKLDEVPEGPGALWCLPLRTVAPDGAPARAVFLPSGWAGRGR